MNLKKMKNLVLSLVGALFLSVFFCGANSLKAAEDTTTSGHKIYFLASETIFNDASELEAADFGTALSGTKNRTGGLRVEAYYTEYVQRFYYVKIDGLDYDEADVFDWLYDYTQPNQDVLVTEDAYGVNTSFYSVNASGKVTAIYHEMYFGSEIVYGNKIFAVGGLYDEPETINPSDVELNQIIFRNESYRNVGSILQRPDLGEGTKVQYHDVKDDKYYDYFSDGIHENLTNINVEDETGAVSAATMKVKLDPASGSELFVVSDGANLSISHELNIGSGLKMAAKSMCRELQAGKLKCEWSYETLKGSESKVLSESGVYYVGFKYVSKIGTEVIRVLKINLVSLTNVDVSAGLELKKASGGTINGSYDLDGVFNYVWANENVSLHMNATNMYMSYEIGKIKNITYTFNGTKSILCEKTLTGNQCNNTILEAKTAVIEFASAQEGVNLISFEFTLGDSDSTVVKSDVIVRLDLSAPIEPEVVFSQAPKLYDGDRYFITNEITVTVDVGENEYKGSGNFSGLASSKLSLRMYNNGTFTKISNAVTDVLVEKDDVLKLSELATLTNGKLYQLTIVSIDKASNESKLEYEFYLDYGYPKFDAGAGVIIDESATESFVDPDTNNVYYKKMSFYVPENKVLGGNSGIKHAEFCAVKLNSATNTNPSVSGCTWNKATLESGKYIGSTDGLELFGYYRIAFRATSNLNETISNENIIFNGIAADEVKYLSFDNSADEIDFVQETDDVWGNDKITLTFSVVNTFSPLDSYEVIDLSDDSSITVTEDNGKYSFDVLKNGDYKIIVKDIVGNTTEETFTISGIDTIAPVLSSIKFDSNYISENLYLTEASSLVIAAYDDASGIKTISVNVYKFGTETKIFESNKVKTCTDNTCSTFTIHMSESNISENGLYDVYIKLTDRAGNVTEFRTSSETSYFVENQSGKVKLNGIITDIDYTGSDVVTISENGTWLVNGVETYIGAVYKFNYLNGSPTVSVDYSLTEDGLKYPTAGKVIYSKNEIYLYVNLPDVAANMEVKYAICDTLTKCVNYTPVIDYKIKINDEAYVNKGKIYYVKILSSYTGTTGEPTENVVSFMLDNLSDQLSIVAEKQVTSTISQTVDINVVSDKNGGSPRNRVLYFYSPSQLGSVDSESQFASANIVNNTNIVTATLNGYYYFFFEDKSLNQSFGFVRITIIDNVAPVVKFNEPEWKKIYQSFSTVISVVDESVNAGGSANSQCSMVTNFAYAWTMNPDAVFTASQLTTVNSGFESIKTTTLSKTTSSYIVDGVYYLYIYVKDHVGNEYQGVDTNYYVIIDNTVPTTDNISTTIQFRSGSSWVTADASTLWFNSSINVKITASEYNFATSQYVSIVNGVYGKVVYAVALSTEVDSTYTYSSHTAFRFSTYQEELGNGIVITDEGQYKIFIYAIDEANNVSGQVIVYVNIDKTAPALKAGYTSVLSSNFSHSVEKIENNSEGVSSFSYDSIITSADIINYIDNMDVSGVTYKFNGVFTDVEGTIEYISPSSPAAYSREEKIKYTRNNFLKCAEDNKTYYIKLILEDRAGNEYVEMIDIFIATSVPPIITLIKTTLGCEDNLATTVLCHLNLGTNQHEIKLIYGDEDINGNRYITPDSRINPKEILINIGIDSFTTYINAKVEDNIDRTYHITSTTYNLDLKQEGSSAYICFTATDSSGNVVGNVNACNFDSDAEFREYLIEYIYQRDKMNAESGEEPPRLTSDEVANTEEYITADQNRIKLTVGYLNGPYLSFIPFDPKNVSFDSTSRDYISNFAVTYLQKDIVGVDVPKYVEPGVYFADYDNIVNVYNTFATVGDLRNKIGVEIKRYVHIDTVNEKFEDTPEFILTHWNDSAFFVPVEYNGGAINLETPANDTIYVIRYVDNQHVDESSTTRNIFRKIVYTSGVPIIDSGIYLSTNVIQVEKSSTDAIPIEGVVSCFVYDNDGNKDLSGCNLNWNIYDMNYKLLGGKEYSIPKNKIGAYRIIFSAIDVSNRIQAPTTEIVINVVDTTAPTISFTKDSYKYMTVEYGTTFRDAYTGIIVTDDYDSGSLTYEVSGTVETSKLGCYTLLYSAKDSSKNVGYNQRVVCVVDTQKPLIEMKDGYVNDTTTDGQDIVNAKVYKYERSSLAAFNLKSFINGIVVNVSDNRAKVSTDDLLIEELVTVNPTRCGNYVVKVSLNDLAGYTFDFGTSELPTGILKSTPDNIAVEYIIIQVIDTIAPDVNVTDLNSRYIENNSIVTEVNSVLRVNLFDEEQYEYGDTITIKLNGNEISASELTTGISANGYYHYEFIDSSGNTTTFTFILMMASYPTIRIESSSVTFDIINSNLADVNEGVATVKLSKEDSTKGITYEVGESIVMLGYSTVSSTERYDILYSIVLTESLVNLLKIDDYEFEVSGITLSNVLITKMNIANTKKLGIGVNTNQNTENTEESGGNTTVGIIAIVGLVAVAGGAFMLLKKKKNKN